MRWSYLSMMETMSLTRFDRKNGLPSGSRPWGVTHKTKRPVANRTKPTSREYLLEVGRGSGWSCTGCRGGKKRIGGRHFAVLRHPGANFSNQRSDPWPSTIRLQVTRFFSRMFKVQKHEHNEHIDMKQIKMEERERERLQKSKLPVSRYVKMKDV